MTSASAVEHFVTLFDSKFLPAGLALHESLLRHAAPCHLWVLCMDTLAEEQLSALALPSVTVIPLREVERAPLLSVKATRTRAEYCWTLTPFVFGAVFDRAPQLDRVTYLDADLFFFGDPRRLLTELTESDKDILITEHAYAPEYDLTEKAGRFCVQFLTARNTAGAHKVLAWWQARCLEWCFARAEPGRYGDQKYLDCWPACFSAEVHVLQQTSETLAPWNVRASLAGSCQRLPVLYHFHGLRIVARERVLLYTGYRVGPAGGRLYREYLSALQRALTRMTHRGWAVPTLPQTSLRERLKAWKNAALGKQEYATLRGECSEDTLSE